MYGLPPKYFQESSSFCLLKIFKTDGSSHNIVMELPFSYSKSRFTKNTIALFSEEKSFGRGSNFSTLCQLSKPSSPVRQNGYHPWSFSRKSLTLLETAKHMFLSGITANPSLTNSLIQRFTVVISSPK